MKVNHEFSLSPSPLLSSLTLAVRAWLRPALFSWEPFVFFPPCNLLNAS